LLAERDELGVEGAVAVASAFAQPDHAHLLAPYAERYFAALPGMWSSRTELYRIMLGQVLFPYYAASPQLIEQIDAFLAAEDRDPGLARVLVEGRDMVERALRSRALPA
jgi:aminopeptidase N